MPSSPFFPPLPLSILLLRRNKKERDKSRVDGKCAKSGSITKYSDIVWTSPFEYRSVLDYFFTRHIACPYRLLQSVVCGSGRVVFRRHLSRLRPPHHLCKIADWWGVRGHGIHPLARSSRFHAAGVIYPAVHTSGKGLAASASHSMVNAPFCKVFYHVV